MDRGIHEGLSLTRRQRRSLGRCCETVPTRSLWLPVILRTGLRMMRLSNQDANVDIDGLERLAAQRCATENTEFTSLRRRVFREVALHGGAIGAYEITSQISMGERRVNAASVYRALDFLV